MKLQLTQESLYYMMRELSNLEIDNRDNLSIMNSIFSKADPLIEIYEKENEVNIDKHDKRRSEAKLDKWGLRKALKKDQKKTAEKKVILDLTDNEIQLLQTCVINIINKGVQGIDNVRNMVYVLNVLI